MYMVKHDTCMRQDRDGQVKCCTLHSTQKSMALSAIVTVFCWTNSETASNADDPYGNTITFLPFAAASPPRLFVDG